MEVAGGGGGGWEVPGAGACFECGGGGGDGGVQAAELLPPNELLPRRESPVSMMSTAMCSQFRKVRSLAKKVFGSTRVRTRALDLAKPTERRQPSAENLGEILALSWQIAGMPSQPAINANRGPPLSRQNSAPTERAHAQPSTFGGKHGQGSPVGCLGQLWLLALVGSQGSGTVALPGWRLAPPCGQREAPPGTGGGALRVAVRPQLHRLVLLQQRWCLYVNLQCRVTTGLQQQMSAYSCMPGSLNGPLEHPHWQQPGKDLGSQGHQRSFAKKRSHSPPSWKHLP